MKEASSIAGATRESFEPFPAGAVRIREVGGYVLFLLPAEKSLLVWPDDDKSGFLIVSLADLREIIARLESGAPA